MVNFRDKGIPVDNISNYDSSTEIILYISTGIYHGQEAAFVTEQSMCKLVAGSRILMFQNEPLQLQNCRKETKSCIWQSQNWNNISTRSQKNYFLRFCNRRYSGKEKRRCRCVGACGSDGELLTDVWQLNNGKEEIIMIKRKFI